MSKFGASKEARIAVMAVATAEALGWSDERLAALRRDAAKGVSDDKASTEILFLAEGFDQIARGDYRLARAWLEMEQSEAARALESRIDVIQPLG